MAKKNEGGTATANPPAAAPARGQFSPIQTARKTVGQQRTADRGIRQRVVSLVLSAGADGISSDKLQEAWKQAGKTASASKVADCMGILASDEYGYPVERLTDPVNRGQDMYRFTPGVALAVAQAPAQSQGGQGQQQGGSTQTLPDWPASIELDLGNGPQLLTRVRATGSRGTYADDANKEHAVLRDEKGQIHSATKVSPSAAKTPEGMAELALRSQNPKEWVKENVPEADRQAVRQLMRKMA